MSLQWLTDCPGVAPGVGANGDSMSMNGQRGFSNGFFIDGATAEWQCYGKQSSTMVQDWIQELQVMINSFSAEFGTASGGILNDRVHRRHGVRRLGHIEIEHHHDTIMLERH